MRLEDLRPSPGAVKDKRRRGRGPGSGLGKTSGRGHKGQKSRGSSKVEPWFEGGQTPLQRRLPKRGFKNINKRIYAVVNVRTLEEKFDEGEEVTPELLLERGVIKNILDGVKILGDGEITKPLVVKAHVFSRSAREKIEKVGGKVEVI